MSAPSRLWLLHPVLNWLRSFAPTQLPTRPRDMVLGALGAGLGLLATAWLSHQALGTLNPWLIAPMGASAVLLFAVPASPLAQPWPALGGSVVSALLGVACCRWLGPGAFAAALAGALAIAAMFALRCLHPPGGAVAMTAVLGGPNVQQLGFGFALTPVAVNAALLVLAALLVNNALRRRYPHQPATHPHGTHDPLPSARAGLTREDLDAALATYGETLDIDRDDLAAVLMHAQLHASQRRWGALRCEDVMSRDVVTVRRDESLDEAWSRLVQHRINALPVVDAWGRLQGILSLHDFFMSQGAQLPERTPRMTLARRVEDIMTHKVRHARPDQPVADLVHAFSDGGLHHMPVLDEDRHVIGMVTQSDVVAALFAAPATATAAEPRR